MGYAELHCKTNFSFLEGASHPEEIIRRAKDLHLSAVAITDRNGVYGIVRAHHSAKELQMPLIIGSEVAVGKDKQHSIILLCKNRIGYGNLCKLLSHIHQRAEAKDQVHADIHTFDPYRSQLIALLPPPYPEKNLSRLKEIFSKNLYITVQRFLEKEDRSRMKIAQDLSQEYNLPLLATNDVHYHTPGRQNLQDILCALRYRTTVRDAGYRLFSNAERHLKSEAEMFRLFKGNEKLVHRSGEIAHQCQFTLNEIRYIYPNEFLPKDETSDSYLSKLTWQGAKKTYPKGIPSNVKKQLNHELCLISELSFADYFLTIWDIVQYARGQGILCQGRGSAANSAVCYVLGITAIDPVRMNLLFERFISAERGEPPDIDVDFEHERREEVIQYIYRRYGRDRAGMVAEVVCYRKRSAIRDVSKALGVPHLEANQISKSFKRRDHSAITPEFFKSAPVTLDQMLVQKIIENAVELRGFPRHLSTHVGGFILTADLLTENVPIEKAAMPNRSIIQWDKNDLAELGMLKVDILGLGMLTAIRKCIDLVNNLPATTRKGRKYTLANIPAEDPKVYDMICRADTVGIFQIESRAQMGMLPRLQPRCFNDLVIEVAIIRPGPIQGGMVHPFLRRRRGEEKVTYPHPKLKEILHKTHGIPLFQEQVMKIAVCVGGFNPGEADQLRRAMGIWRTHRSKPMIDLAQKLMTGMQKNGIAPQYARQIFEQIKGFGEFGFPESHSASFALLVYASAYLKCFYPPAFTCAILNSQPMGFYAEHTLVDDLKRHGFPIYPVDIHKSEHDSTLENGQLRLGFRLIRGLSKKNLQLMLDERGKEPFQSLDDFLTRTRFRSNELVLLASANAFHSFGLDRRDAVWKVQGFLRSKSRLFPTLNEKHQTDFLPDVSEKEHVSMDYQLQGLSTINHPVALIRKDIESYQAVSAHKLLQKQNGESVRAGGMVIVRQSPKTANGMVFITLEDETGFINVALAPPTYEKLRPVIRESAFLLIEGKLQKDGLATSILCKNAWSLTYGSQTIPDIRSRDFH